MAFAGAGLLLIAVSWFTFDYQRGVPQRAAAEIQIGINKMKPGTYAEAVRHFSRALDLQPASAPAYLNRGVARHALGQQDLALEDLARAIEIDPTLTRAHDERGRIYIERKDAANALKELSKSIELRPTTAGYYQRGLLYESLGEHEKAISDYDRAVMETPDSPFAYRARALAKANLGDAKGAQRDRESADRMEGIRPVSP